MEEGNGGGSSEEEEEEEEGERDNEYDYEEDDEEDEDTEVGPRSCCSSEGSQVEEVGDNVFKDENGNETRLVAEEQVDQQSSDDDDDLEPDSLLEDVKRLEVEAREERSRSSSSSDHTEVDENLVDRIFDVDDVDSSSSRMVADRPGSNYSQRSVSYFVDFDGEGLGEGGRMTKSMFAQAPSSPSPDMRETTTDQDEEDEEGGSRHSSVSFYVDMTPPTSAKRNSEYVICPRLIENFSPKHLLYGRSSRREDITLVQQSPSLPPCSSRPRGPPESRINNKQKNKNNKNLPVSVKMTKSLGPLLPTKYQTFTKPQVSKKGAPKVPLNSKETDDAAFFFEKVSECVEMLSAACLSRTEIRAKLRMAKRAEEIMRIQEDRIKQGKPGIQRKLLGKPAKI